MNNKKIFEKVIEMKTPEDNYLMFQVESNCYFGKDYEGNVVFMLMSSSPNISAVHQETKSLKFAFNKRCVLQCDNTLSSKVMHVLTCKEKDNEKIKAFIRLTKSFSINEPGLDQYYLAKLFSSISALFDKQRQINESEIQGLFAELYTILFLRNSACDIAKYWQSRNKMKFDFSLNEIKRIEIKSTLKAERTHHFRHEQLLSKLYDIKVVSMMLRKNDCGVSLFNVVDAIRELYADNFALMLHIETVISQIDEDLLQNLRYDKVYLENNLRFYDAKNIPHFNEKTPDGVFNAEYDCNLDMTQHLTKLELIEWLTGGY